jgi:proteasome lid subunit RPN8/RPN11
MNVYKNKPKNDFILGWAHSHPSYTPFLSQDDINTQLRYQALWEDSIAVVIDPAMITKINHGYSVFRLTEARDIYYEVKNKIEGMSATAAYQALNLLLKEKGIKAGQFN